MVPWSMLDVAEAMPSNSTQPNPTSNQETKQTKPNQTKPNQTYQVTNQLTHSTI
jgi:hypothetical protein